MSKIRYLSGIQPTGTIHLGNYFSVIEPAIANQSDTKRESLYFVADYHALTQNPDKETLSNNIENAVIDYLACGLDPDKVIFFVQSDVRAITEIYWILSNFTPLGLLERSHSYKDKIARGIASSHSLLSYPVLMASDILAYDSDIVPVGKDQKQHIEITRDIAIKFNNFYKKEILKIPKWEIKDDTGKILGIDGEKMSKSYNNSIPLFDEEKKQRKRIMKIKTDSAGIDDIKNHKDSVIFHLYSLFSSKSEIDEFSLKFKEGGYGYGELKQELFEKYIEYFRDKSKKRDDLLKSRDYISEILRNGSEKANKIADNTLKKMKESIGLKIKQY